MFRSILHFCKNAKTYLIIFFHRDTPLYIKGVVAVAVLYLFSPYDLLPDWIVGLGFIDDIAIVSLLIGFAVRLVDRRKRKSVEDNGKK